MSRIGAAIDGVLGIDPNAPALEFETRWHNWGAISATKAAIEQLIAPAGEGARIGVMMRNRPGAVAATLACVARGACLVTINPLYPDDKLADDIVGLAPPILICGPDDWMRAPLAEAAARIGALQIIVSDDLATAPVVRAPAAHPFESFPRRVAPGIGVEMLTSGTTGAPKRIPLKAEAFAASVLSAAEYEAGRSGDDAPRLRGGVQFLLAPISHIGGLMALLNSIIAGRKACMFERFAVAPFHDALKRHRPKVVSMPPAALRMLIDAELPPEDFSSLAAIRTGTAPLDPALADAVFARFNTPVLQNYGATEFGGVAGWTIGDFREHWSTKRGAVGRLNAGIDARVTDADTQAPLPPGAEGVLQLRGARIGDGENWITTTDLAIVDADNFLYIRGRTDNAIIRGGFKVQPDDIIRAMQQHEAILEAAVAALPDARLGHAPGAAYVLKNGARDPGEAALAAFLRTQLAPYQIPIRFLRLDELPRTPSMKVSQPALRALLEARGA